MDFSFDRLKSLQEMGIVNINKGKNWANILLTGLVFVSPGPAKESWKDLAAVNRIMSYTAAVRFTCLTSNWRPES